jgi:hypothetical protein
MLLVLRAGANVRSALAQCLELQLSGRDGVVLDQAAIAPVGLWFGDPAEPPLPYATCATADQTNLATVHSSVRLGDWALLWLSRGYRIEQLGRTQCRRSILASIEQEQAGAADAAGRFVPVFTRDEPTSAELPRLRREFAGLVAADVMRVDLPVRSTLVPRRSARAYC